MKMDEMMTDLQKKTMRDLFRREFQERVKAAVSKQAVAAADKFAKELRKDEKFQNDLRMRVKKALLKDLDKMVDSACKDACICW